MGVEQNGRTKLIDKALERRQEDIVHKQQVAEARAQIPGVRQKVDQLFRDHFDLSPNHRNLVAEIACTIPSGETTVEAIVRKYVDHAEYRVELGELDEVLVLKPGAALVESKTREHKHSMDAVIGVPVRNSPTWTREATVADLKNYAELLDHVASGETKYTPRWR